MAEKDFVKAYHSTNTPSWVLWAMLQLTRLESKAKGKVGEPERVEQLSLLVPTTGYVCGTPSRDAAAEPSEEL